MAAAGGEKLKAALRTIYEDDSSPRRHMTTTMPTTTTTTKLVMHLATTVAGSSTGKPLASIPSSPTSEEIKYVRRVRLSIRPAKPPHHNPII